MKAIINYLLNLFIGMKINNNINVPLYSLFFGAQLNIYVLQVGFHKKTIYIEALTDYLAYNVAIPLVIGLIWEWVYNTYKTELDNNLKDQLILVKGLYYFDFFYYLNGLSFIESEYKGYNYDDLSEEAWILYWHYVEYATRIRVLNKRYKKKLLKNRNYEIKNVINRDKSDLVYFEAYLQAGYLYGFPVSFDLVDKYVYTEWSFPDECFYPRKEFAMDKRSIASGKYFAKKKEEYTLSLLAETLITTEVETTDEDDDYTDDSMSDYDREKKIQALLIQDEKERRIEIVEQKVWDYYELRADTKGDVMSFKPTQKTTL
jgi:hypothetical protein